MPQESWRSKFLGSIHELFLHELFMLKIITCVCHCVRNSPGRFHVQENEMEGGQGASIQGCMVHEKDVLICSPQSTRL